MAAMAGAESVCLRLPFWLEKGLVLVECCCQSSAMLNWATTGAWPDSGNRTSVRNGPDSSGRYSLWTSVCSEVASNAREART